VTLWQDAYYIRSYIYKFCIVSHSHKLTVVIMWDIIAINFIQNLIQYSFSTLSPYVGETIGDYQCGFRRNRPTTDHIFCIRQILEENWSIMK
jgi:hypothetical protein